MSALNSQFGAKVETTAGTEVVVDRFWPVSNVKFKPRRFTADEQALRATGIVERMSGTRVQNLGGTLTASFPLMTAGMGWWLRFLMGGTATSGPTDSAYTHTGTMAVLYGDSFTCQTNFPLFPAGTNQAITCVGCKVTKWSLSVEPTGEGNGDPGVMLEVEIDVSKFDDDTALASASYATALPYTWADLTTLTYSGTAINLNKLKISVDNKLKIEDYKLRASNPYANEQQDVGFKEVKVEVEADFYDLTTFWNVYRATTAASTAAQLIGTFTCADSGGLIGASTSPSTTLTIPKLRIDEFDDLEVGFDKTDVMQKITGVSRWDASNNPFTWAMVTSDSTA